MPRPRELERGSILARSVVIVFVATLLFAAGAALGGAFGASADDGTPVEASSLGTSTDETTSTADTSTEATTSDAATTAPAPTTTVVETAPPPGSTNPPAVGGGGPSSSHHHPAASHEDSTSAPRSKHRHRRPHAPITWVPRVLPDPIPAAHRLSPGFARNLREAARAHDVPWWRVLAVLRAHGRDGRVPAGPAKLDAVARRLANHSIRLNARIYSLAHYDRAVGLHALVTGLERAKPGLERRILRDTHISLTSAGAADVASGRVDVRVLVVIRYLAVTFRQVTVSSLITGHPVFARRRVVSAHMDGLAVDVTRLKGTPILGNQELGGITERAIAQLLRLPQELQPKQIISLLGLGGPSFPQSDHYDHIHVGF